MRSAERFPFPSLYQFPTGHLLARLSQLLHVYTPPSTSSSSPLGIGEGGNVVAK
jgi:hypothetical protein